MGIRWDDKGKPGLDHPNLTATVMALVVVVLWMAWIVGDLRDDRADDRRLIAELIEAEVEQTAVLCQTGALTGEGCEDE